MLVGFLWFVRLYGVDGSRIGGGFARSCMCRGVSCSVMWSFELGCMLKNSNT